MKMNVGRGFLSYAERVARTLIQRYSIKVKPSQGMSYTDGIHIFLDLKMGHYKGDARVVFEGVLDHEIGHLLKTQFVRTNFDKEELKRAIRQRKILPVHAETKLKSFLNTSKIGVFQHVEDLRTNFAHPYPGCKENICKKELIVYNKQYMENMKDGSLRFTLLSRMIFSLRLLYPCDIRFTSQYRKTFNELFAGDELVLRFVKSFLKSKLERKLRGLKSTEDSINFTEELLQFVETFVKQQEKTNPHVQHKKQGERDEKESQSKPERQERKEREEKCESRENREDEESESRESLGLEGDDEREDGQQAREEEPEDSEDEGADGEEAREVDRESDEEDGKEDGEEDRSHRDEGGEEDGDSESEDDEEDGEETQEDFSSGGKDRESSKSRKVGREESEEDEEDEEIEDGESGEGLTEPKWDQLTQSQKKDLQEYDSEYVKSVWDGEKDILEKMRREGFDAESFFEPADPTILDRDRMYFVSNLIRRGKIQKYISRGFDQKRLSDLYRELLKETNTVIQQLNKVFLQKFYSRTASFQYHTDEEDGVFDVMEVGKMFFIDGYQSHSPRIKTIEGDKRSIAVTVLVDGSGSMDGQRLTSARDMSIAMSEVFKRLNVSSEFIVHNTYSRASITRYYSEGRNLSYRMFVVKSFEELSFANLALINRFGNNNNADGAVMQKAGTRLLERPEDRKIFFYICDGLPTAYVSHVAGVEHMRFVANEMMKNHIEFYAIGISTEKVVDLFGTNYAVNIANEQDLERKLAALITSRF